MRRLDVQGANLRLLRQRGEGAGLKPLHQVLVAAALAVGLVFATPAEAQAPLNPVKIQQVPLSPKQYAKQQVIRQWDSGREYACLVKLWTKESNWNPRAYNKIKVDGRNAGGIPQILGLSPKLHHTKQIDRGLKYIKHRYGTPCKAWNFWLHKDKNGTGWY